jgi:hypothetical protein
MVDAPGVSPAEEQQHAARRWTGLGLGLVFMFASIFLFLLSSYLENRFQNQKTVWEVLKTFSLALLPAVLVALVDHYYTIGQITTQVIGEMEATAASHEANTKHMILDLIKGRKQYGLVAFHEAMDFSGLFQGLHAGDELLWLDTYVTNYRAFQRQFQDALIRGVRVRMLVIDPKSQNAEFRASEITAAPGFTYGQFNQEIETFTEQLQIIAEDPSVPQGSCTIRQYRDLPCLPMYIILRQNEPVTGYSSIFLTQPTGVTGVPCVHFQWQPTEGGLLGEMWRYFEQKWAAQVLPHGKTIFPRPLASDDSLPVPELVSEAED